jgi:hypothetical protein
MKMFRIFLKIEMNAINCKVMIKEPNNTERRKLAQAARKDNTKANGGYSERILTAPRRIVKI